MMYHNNPYQNTSSNRKAEIFVLDRLPKAGESEKDRGYIRTVEHISLLNRQAFSLKDTSEHKDYEFYKLTYSEVEVEDRASREEFNVYIAIKLKDIANED